MTMLLKTRTYDVLLHRKEGVVIIGNPFDMPPLLRSFVSSDFPQTSYIIKLEDYSGNLPLGKEFTVW